VLIWKIFSEFSRFRFLFIKLVAETSQLTIHKTLCVI